MQCAHARSLPLTLVIGLAILMAWSILAAPDALAATKTFKPVDKKSAAFVFKPAGVDPAAVRRARVRIHRAGGDRVRRRVGSGRLRRALVSSETFKVRVGRRARKGALRVRLGQPAAQAESGGGSGACRVAPETLTAVDCQTLFEDLATTDPESTWGAVDCEVASRHRTIDGGDFHPTAAGSTQADSRARELTVFDGDDVWGERCELGENSHRYGKTVLYGEGQRRVTFVSFRLPQSFPLDTGDWQSVMQMKQTQPSANGGGTPVISLKANKGAWSLVQSNSAGPSEDSRQLWSAPATANTWTRFAFDIRYSRDASQGSITIYADLNADGDALDPGEQSETIGTYTLKYETAGGNASDGIAPGESIPSHLRTGIYHSPSIDCPPPVGCSSQVDNVQVVG